MTAEGEIGNDSLIASFGLENMLLHTFGSIWHKGTVISVIPSRRCFILANTRNRFITSAAVDKSAGSEKRSYDGFVSTNHCISCSYYMPFSELSGFFFRCFLPYFASVFKLQLQQAELILIITAQIKTSGQSSNSEKSRLVPDILALVPLLVTKMLWRPR